jgi:hypothetical protein
MRYLVVMILSLGVGAVVYVLSMRAEETEPVAIGFEPPPREEPPGAPEPASAVEGPAPGYAYLQVAVTSGPSLRERIQGLVGSLALVALAAVVVAGGFYAVGALISRLVQAFVGDTGP